MAFDEIIWVVHVQAKREPSARRVLQRVVAAIGQSAEERLIERHLEVPERYVAVFATPLDVLTVPEAVFQTMLAAQELGSGWLVLGPSSSDDGRWAFEMICAASASGRFRISGIDWAHASLETHGDTVAVTPIE